MSTVKANNVQVGQSGTPTNNFTLYQPTVPDGTVRLGVGNAGSVTDIITTTSAGNVGIGTSSPAFKLDVANLGTSTSVAMRLISNDSGGNSVRTLFTQNADGSFTLNANQGGNGSTAAIIFQQISSESMRIDSSGNLLVGATAPYNATSDRLTVLKAQNFPTQVVIDNQNSNSSAGAALSLNAYGGGATFFVPAAVPGTNPLVISVNGTERMRIDSSGSLLVGTTSSSDNTAGVKLSPVGGGYPGILKIMKTVSGGVNAVLNYHSGNYVGGIDFSNVATSFITSSDVRLKKNIFDAPSALLKVQDIRVVSHGWKHDDAIAEYGVIAQELALVAPSAVTQGDDGEEVVTTWSVDYSKLVPILVKAIQELAAEITALKSEINLLKGN